MPTALSSMNARPAFCLRAAGSSDECLKTNHERRRDDARRDFDRDRAPVPEPVPFAGRQHRHVQQQREGPQAAGDGG